MVDQDLYGESADVTWPLDSTTMYAPVVRPVGPGPFPAVVMEEGCLRAGTTPVQVRRARREIPPRPGTRLGRAGTTPWAAQPAG